MGIWQVGRPQGSIEVLHQLPTPADFHERFVKGVGKPVFFPGAAKGMPAYHAWTDDYLQHKHGATKLDQVETEKLETRTALPYSNWKLAKFVSEYKHRDIYSVAVTPKGLNKEVYLLPVINCGGYHGKMQATSFWFSSGGTKSVIHSDGQHNIHCAFAGEKSFMLWHPKAGIDTTKFGWMTFGDGGDEGKEKLQEERFRNAYGSFAARVNVEDVDLDLFPGYDTLPWWNVTLRAGDCAYIPPKWFHHVESAPQRTISVHVWFGTKRAFDAASCEALHQQGYNLSNFIFRLYDCTFDEDGRKTTKCKPSSKLKRELHQEL
eukprot:NODE_1741_length_1071_cov_291.266732.p1 GENE.NODE_1741_length_1071_cov_291.266732~~NODE_1741_length_1071_cov_291.266732.p1  ORF type:complete len:319 (+),score=68.93 NODE_1741_length_1071_cov_291.266732:3-959(+)